MKSIKGRGRPIENDVLILKYTQKFTDIFGNVYIWNFDKTKHPNGPYSVEIHNPIYDKADKIQKKIDNILKLYESKPGQRKKRITKADKNQIDSLTKNLEEFHYSLFPEDRPVVKIRKNAKNSQKKIPKNRRII